MGTKKQNIYSEIWQNAFNLIFNEKANLLKSLHHLLLSIQDRPYFCKFAIRLGWSTLQWHHLKKAFFRYTNCSTQSFNPTWQFIYLNLNLTTISTFLITWQSIMFRIHQLQQNEVGASLAFKKHFQSGEAWMKYKYQMSYQMKFCVS